jgi:RimJ/RimL family protein N-acetyltransferase
VTIRPARDDDARRLRAWRNEPATRAASFSSEPIALPDHERWLAGKLTDPSVYLGIVEDGGEAIGQIRIEGIGSARAEVHVGLAAQARGRGLGRAALTQVAGIARQRGVSELTARVKPGNAASLRAFAGAGFTVREARPGEIVLSLVLG